MSDTDIIEAMARERSGKGAARALRWQGRVPAVVYGDKKAPESISVEAKGIVKEINAGTFSSRLFDLKIDGGKAQRVLPRAVQFDPVTDQPVHIDFLRLARDASVRIMLPVNFIGEEECPGLKRGGVLNVVRHEIEFNCPVDSIPDGIEVDLSGLDIGDGVHISAVALPDGVEPTITDRDFTIVTVAAPTVTAEPEEEGEEGEVDEAAEGAEATEPEAGGEEEEA